MNLSELVISLVVHSDKAQKSLIDTKKGIVSVGDSAKKSGESIRKYLDTALSSLVKTALPIATVTGAMVALTKAQNELVAVGKQAETTGVPVEDLQAWARAAEKMGYSAEDAKNGLVDFHTSLAEATLTGQGKTAAWLRDLGIRLLDANGKARSASDMMRDLSKTFSKMSQQKAFFIGKQMGLTPDLIAMLRRGTDLTNELADAYKHVQSQDEVNRAMEFDGALRSLTITAEDFAKNLFVAVAPAITTVFNALQPIAQFAADNPFATIAVAGALAFKTLSKAIMANPIGLAITALTLVISDFYNLLNGAPSLTGDFLEWLGLSEESLNKFKESVLDTWEGVKNFFGFGSDESTKGATASASPSSVYNGGNSSVDNRSSSTQIHNDIVVNSNGNAQETKQAVSQGVADAMSAYGSTAENFNTGVSY